MAKMSDLVVITIFAISSRLLVRSKIKFWVAEPIAAKMFIWSETFSLAGFVIATVVAIAV